MPTELTPFLALAGGGLVFTVAGVLSMFLRPEAPGNALLNQSSKRYVKSDTFERAYA